MVSIHISVGSIAQPRICVRRLAGSCDIVWKEQVKAKSNRDVCFLHRLWARI